jgi:hypothetical protein
MATAGQQSVGHEQCLLRVVGDRADRQPRCDHVVCGRLAKPVEDTEARSDLFGRHQLGRHAERIANRQAIQRALGAVEDRTHLATDARMLSTSAMSIIGL